MRLDYLLYPAENSRERQFNSFTRFIDDQLCNCYIFCNGFSRNPTAVVSRPLGTHSACVGWLTVAVHACLSTWVFHESHCIVSENSISPSPQSSTELHSCYSPEGADVAGSQVEPGARVLMTPDPVNILSTPQTGQHVCQ